MDHTRSAWQVSIRRACRALPVDRSTYHYRSRRSGQAELSERIKAIAATRVRYGYRRIHVLLRREGWLVNAKRVYRIYREMGLQLRNKTPKRRVKAKLRDDRHPATRLNETWAMDFVHDQLATGRKLRVLTIIDTFSRFSPAVEPRFNFRGADQQKRVGELSGGERNRVHLAKLLTSGGNVLLLDEPTNDLDVETLRALEQALLDFPGCAVVISHDRWFLDRVATHILAFEGDSKAVWFEGNFADYIEDWRKRVGEDADNPHRIRYKALVA